MGRQEAPDRILFEALKARETKGVHFFTHIALGQRAPVYRDCFRSRVQFY
jgi:hypothetical protein